METFFISKYALSNGIREDEFEVSGEWACERYGMYKIGRDAHRSKAEAMMAAEKMRVAKVASLKKQIAKLEAMSFDPIPYRLTEAGRAMLRDAKQGEG